MHDFHIALAATTSVILFIFGLEHFSKEIQAISGERFRKFLSKATSIPWVGMGIGAVVTALIQSSSATSVICVSLVNAGVLSFKNSIGIIFGSNAPWSLNLTFPPEIEMRHTLPTVNLTFLQLP